MWSPLLSATICLEDISPRSTRGNTPSHSFCATTAAKPLCTFAGIAIGSIAASTGAAEAACTNVGGSNIVCSGANTETQYIFDPNAQVTTEPGFSVDTAGSFFGEAIYFFGSGSLSYTDLGDSSLAASTFGIFGSTDGSFDVTINGSVTGNLDDAISLGGGTGVRITVNPGGSVTNIGDSADDFAIEITRGPAIITIAGTVKGGPGGAIDFEFFRAPADDRLELHPGGVIEGNVFARGGSNTLALGGIGVDAFDVSAIGAVSQFRDFGIFEKSGSSTWTLTGTTSALTPWNIKDGILSVSSDDNLGAPQGALSFDGGLLRVTGTSFTGTQRNIIWGPGGGGFDIAAASNEFAVSQSLGGPGGLAKSGAGTLVLAGSNSYEGATTVSAGTLRAAATGAFSPNSAHVIGLGGTLDLAGFDQTVPSLTNRGRVRTGGAADTALTVTGSYVANSTLVLNSVLGSDNSPSDRLIIDGGKATGSTAVAAHDIGGGGALTTGDGILVIQAINGGTTDPNAFGPALAVAGPYEYTLHRGDKSGSQPDNWYLRNELQPPQPQPSPPTPRYRQEVSLYAAIQPMAAIYGLHLIDTLHERVGEEEQLRGKPSAAGRDTANGAWGRIIGHSGERQGDTLGIYGGAPEFDYDFTALQAGLDLLGRERTNGGRDYAGLYLAYGHGELDVTHSLPILNRSFTAGNDEFDAFSLGGYWTSFGAERDWYLDAVLQGTWYDVTTHSLRNILVGFPDQDVSGFGFAASLEAGYPFDLGNGWSVEPQAQLVYQAIDFDDFNDGAAEVRFSNLDSLAGRIGARLARSWGLLQEHGPDAPPRLATAWGRIDLWNEFLADTSVSFSSADGFIPFSADLEESWINLGIGASLEVAPRTTIYGNVNYQTSFNSDSHGFDGKLGVRMNW